MSRRIGMLSIVSILVLLLLLTPAGDIGVKKVSAGGFCDWAKFIADVTIPDGVPVDPAFVFKKTWRIKNIGTCTWTKSYKVVFVSGEQMGGVAAMNLPRDVAPGQTIDLTISMTAPFTPGFYRGYWQLQNPSGGLFGMGTAANMPFWVEINVVSKSAPVFDFAANAPAANWRTELSGKRPFPGVYGDPLGFVLTVDQPALENGIPTIGKGILMAPPFEFHEQIFGIFPNYKVKTGDRFQAMVGCEFGSRDCDVTFVLQYKDDSGIHSYWNVSKSYKNSFNRVNVSLNYLAGRTVQFILMIRPNGVTIGDHALWANPVIVNSFDPAPSIPTVTSAPVTTVPGIPTLAATAVPYTGCDRATFVSDVTVPDGTVFTPGQTFTKTWRFKNTGRCTWTTDYVLVFSAGDQMGGPSPINLPNAVAPNQTVDLSVNLTAPGTPGNYSGYWLFKNATGNFFGIGLQANKPFWLSIAVSGMLPPTSGNGYDFVAHACEAQWTSGGGLLGCPDATPMNGTISIITNPRLENNTIDSRSALLTIPNNVFNGYIQGVFPPFTVQTGDHFKSIVNCEYGQRSCYVVFRLDYQIDNGPIKNLWGFGERYEGLYYQADIDLSMLAGQNVKFILGVNANGSPTGDRAMWVAPSIVRSGGPVPVTPTPTDTATPTATPTLPEPTQTSTPTSTPTATVAAPVDTETPTPTPTFAPTSTPTPTLPVVTGNLTYTNQKSGFQFAYPANAVITTSQDSFVHVNLPIVQGTNLGEKYLEASVFENATTCSSSLANGNPNVTSETVTTMNGLQFLKQSSQDRALGNIYDWVAYSTMKGTTCVTLNFVLHSTNPDNYPVPPPLFDQNMESAVFLDIVSSFNWTSP